MPASISTVTPRIGARVLLLNPDNRVLLIHALDPTDPVHHWWELPGGGLDVGEDLRDAARREVAEETGICSAGPSSNTQRHSRVGEPGGDL